MDRSPLFIANWKMHKTCAATREFLMQFREKVELNPAQPDVGIAPPLTALAALAEAAATLPGLLVGAQNVHWLAEGAETGEVSTEMLKEHNCQFAICGHSERRPHYGETSRTVSLRAKAAIDAGMMAVVCCGESKEDFDAGKTEDVLEQQLRISLKTLESKDLPLLTVAYEPIWAIGTGLTATPEIAQNVHSFIRELLRDLYGEASESLRIIYGGSANAGNIASLISCNNIDGALVGGASLDPETFADLINTGRSAV